MAENFYPSVPNNFDERLIPFKVRQRYFEEYIGLTPLTVFMGTSSNDAIQIFEMENGEGMSYRVSLRRELDYENPILDFDQIAGQEQQPTFYEDEIKIRRIKFADMLMGIDLTKQQTPIKVQESMRDLLMNAGRRYLVKTIFDSGTTDLYNSASGGNGPAASRSLYGGVNHNASIYTAVGTMTGKAYNQSGLSVAHIRKLKSMAITGGRTFEEESLIKPIELKTKRGFPEELYVYLMDTESFATLAEDPAYSQFVYRGVIQGSDQPEGISGARYRGMIEGVLLYECRELARYRIKNSTKVAAWNLFMGAQAFGMCWSKRPYFGSEMRDIGENMALKVAEQRGQKAFMFPSFQNTNNLVERGLIHSFVQIDSSALTGSKQILTGEDNVNSKNSKAGK